MTPIIHNYSCVAGTTVNWDTSDSQQQYFKNIQSADKRQLLAERGYLDTNIDYQFNSHGFRTAEFDHQIDIACFGCSFTMGTGIHANDTWPAQLSALTGLTVANLGHAGSSNDTAFRVADHYLKFLKPRYAIWLQTDMHRIELLDDSDLVSLNIIASDTENPCANDYFTKVWFSSSSNHQLNLAKNTGAFKNLCHQLDIKCLILSRNQVINDWSARDFLHPGPLANQKLAKHICSLID